MRIENFSTYFGDFQVLKDINLEFPSNKVTAIMGPSGCGKTTLLRSINRLAELDPTYRKEGSVWLEDNNIYDPQQDVYELRKKIGMVFQKPNPFPMSIYQNITYGPKLHGVHTKCELDKIIKWSLIQAALWKEVKDRLKEPATNLSGGQQQRLCIARALAINPDVILMDEPVSSLDPISAERIEQLIVDLKKEYTIILVTHNVGQSIRISDYTAFLYLGKLIEFGNTKDIASSPQDHRTEEFLTGRFG
ncbi:MAG: phosphate ABC transporter ATP-binding protein PstB [Candidatus Ranarchaeia archaeon]